jgi:hypothetical protein
MEIKRFSDYDLEIAITIIALIIMYIATRV